MISNARMYAVTPEVEATWRALLAHVAEESGVPLHYEPYPAPLPLENLWRRGDLGAVFMCGFPIATQLAQVIPLAAPIPRAPWAGGRALYRTDLIVREDAPYDTLEDTFGSRAGWTVAHSHSGFNAFRHHLLRFRSAARPTLYGAMTGDLITARRVLDDVREGRLDVGPLDAYWHLLIARHAPQLTQGIRVIASTETAPMPAFVAGQDVGADVVRRLREAFTAASGRAWFSPLAEPLLLEGFTEVSGATYAPLLDWQRQAQAAGYPLPA